MDTFSDSDNNNHDRECGKRSGLEEMVDFVLDMLGLRSL